MRKIFTLACLAFSVFSSAQELRNPEVVAGELIKVIPSLKNLKFDPSLNPRVTRDETGLITKKTFKDETTDFGSSVSGDPVVQKGFVNDLPNAAGQIVGGAVVHRNFDGMNYSNVAPADPTLCAGPNHVIQMINGAQGSYFRIWDKSGNSVLVQTYMYQFFGTPGYSGAGDPIALYDQFADRYVISEFGYSGGITGWINTLIFAVSITNDPTGGWYVYKYKDNSFFVDYPHYSVWPDGYYGTSNDFNTAGTAYLGSSVYAFEKSRMLIGDSIARMQRFRLTSTQYSTKYISVAPVNISGPTPPSAGTPGLFLYFHDDNRTASSSDVDSVGFISLEADFENPSNTVLTFELALTVAAFKSRVCNGSYNCIPSGSFGYDEISDRFMNKIYYRNFGTHESIVGNHTVDANYPATPTKAGIRWYEFRRSGGNWSVHQQGTYSPDTDGRFMGTININAKGQIAVAYNSSGAGAGKFASLRFAARNASDPAGILQYTEREIKKGDAYGTFSNRWGDYNDLVVDPVGDTTFWFTAMYGSTPYWKTRVASVILEEQFSPDTIYMIVPPQVDTAFSTLAYAAGYQYQWQIDSGTGYKNLLASSIFSNVNTNHLGLTNLPSHLTGFKIRCNVTTAADSLSRETFILRFSSTWTGAINTNWNNPGNWSGNVLPDKYTDLIIPAGSNVTVNSNAFCKSLVLAPGATLTVMSGLNLYIQGKPFQ